MSYPNAMSIQKQTSTRPRVTQQESLNAQMLRAMAESMRNMAELADALAIANAGGGDADLLKSADIMRILKCSNSKACGILRAHGQGSGKMARITRGRLIQLQREGRI